MTLDDHLLLLELSRNVSGGRTRNFDPSLREEGASREHEGDIEDGVKWVSRYIGQRGRRGDVIHQTTGGNELAVTFAFLPATKELNEEVTTISLVQELRDEVEVGNQRRLQDDRHVGCVEELDGIVRNVATVLLRLDRQIDAEALKVDDDEENEDGGHQVGDVRQIGAVEGFLERANLVRTREEQVEEGDDRAFKLSASARVHRRRRESLPDDAFALVRGDEERNTGAKTVALLQKLIQADDDDARKEELNDDEQGVADSEVADITIDTAHDVRNGFTDRNQNSQQLLSAVEERSVLLHALIHVDDLGSRE